MTKKEILETLAGMQQSIATIARNTGNHETADKCDKDAQRLLKIAEGDGSKEQADYYRKIAEKAIRKARIGAAKEKAAKYGVELTFVDGGQ